jgi:cytochrome d ubiquinol oxidase subunit I
MLGVVALAWWLRWRGRLSQTGWFLLLCQWTGPLGFVAVLAGWTTTEVGRQPWTVYGLMRTEHSVSPSLTGPDVLWSLLAYVAVYLLMYPAGVLVMARMVRHGPREEAMVPRPIEALQPRAPIADGPTTVAGE